MKTLIVAAAFAGAALAQSLSDLPECGQLCINNMLGAASSLGCPPVNGQPDATCLCANPDFGYGVRDCANEVCPSGTDTNSIIQYGLSYCAAAAPGTSAGALSATSALTAGGTATGTAGTTGSGDIGGSSTPISTETLFSTLTTDGSTITSAIGTSTLYSATGAGATGPSPATTGAETSPATAGGETSPATAGGETSPTTAGAETSPAPTGAETSPTTAGSENAAKPIMSVAANGLVGVAGVAAILLL
ncbi:uncharacterized protein Z518_07306 [Rhinocladiella mackenziei CBS 650.93]|uniref:Rhinocladiella mackenziei CBS 650.93 unplaced genomic scaffold supercont1.5, whole genome shotgun sequence n=1 Tax=Rhinocladiella mackenziei CBS 650.93 TaxID=1442369 RepID=A0A0D2GZX7_9EURO|nr:uncharacterized protein Z518_07306 [Rhinocladiella mackenziei CBS 650.93]KIX03753.1 hypothetical protein Z518_07306 [Rhinocladiella mackenziei CBS 650.93]